MGHSVDSCCLCVCGLCRRIVWCWSCRTMSTVWLSSSTHQLRRCLMPSVTLSYDSLSLCLCLSVGDSELWAPVTSWVVWHAAMVVLWNDLYAVCRVWRCWLVMLILILFPNLDIECWSLIQIRIWILVHRHASVQSVVVCCLLLMLVWPVSDLWVSDWRWDFVM